MDYDDLIEEALQNDSAERIGISGVYRGLITDDGFRLSLRGRWLSRQSSVQRAAAARQHFNIDKQPCHRPLRMDLLHSDIDYPLLRRLLLTTKRIRFKQADVRQLLFPGDEDDDGYVASEGDLAGSVIKLLDLMQVGTYKGLRVVSGDTLQTFINKQRAEGFEPLVALDCLQRLRAMVKMEIPPEVGTAGASVDPSQCTTLTSGPWNVKLGDKKSSLQRGLAHLSITDEPLSVTQHISGKEFCANNEKNRITNLSAMLTEGTYTLSVTGHPRCMEAKARDDVAKTVMPENYGGDKYVKPHPTSKPEQSAGVREELQYHVTMSTEMKSYQTEGVEELIQTSLGHTQSSFFREFRGGQSFQFFEDPPWSLSCLTVGPTVICSFAAEMVGIPLYSIYSAGFTFGTSQANEIMSFVDSKNQQPAVDLANVEDLAKCNTVNEVVQWTKRPVKGKAGEDLFYKIIRYDLFHINNCPEHGIPRGANWRRLFRVYDKYKKSTHGCSGVPNALVSARLLYGEYQVAVEMEFIDTSGPALAIDVTKVEPRDTEDLRKALLFLAKLGFVYVDFRPQNVIRCVTDDRIRLIDYDDMKMVEWPSSDSLKETYEPVLAKLTGTGFGLWATGAINTMLQAYTAEEGY